MEQTLKITNVLSDPTRYYIYQYVTKRQSEVTVQEIADNFEIHPNVARLHLSKLEDVHMLISETKKTGKGGRPSRLYRLSEEIIQLHFPFRDYQLLSKIAIETMISLGPVGKDALYLTGKKYGQELIYSQIPNNNKNILDLSFENKIEILKDAATLAGFYPEITFNPEQTKVYMHVKNCPFKELAKVHTDAVCDMHYAFLQGMFEVLFEGVELEQPENMMNGCENCRYQAFV